MVYWYKSNAIILQFNTEHTPLHTSYYAMQPCYISFKVVAFFGERAVTQFRVVAGEGEVAEAMQPFLLNELPIRPDSVAPGR